MKLPVVLPGAPRRSAFTLIELLVVIGIIAILAGLLIQTAGFVQEKAGRARAEGEIKSLEAGLETYKLDYGSYPQSTSSGDNSTKVLIEELALNPIKNPEQYGNRKPFEFPLKMLGGYKAGGSNDYMTVLNESDYIVDPFGWPYHYEFDPDKDNSDRAGKGNYNLWSQGKKGESNSDEKTWIKNW